MKRIKVTAAVIMVLIMAITCIGCGGGNSDTGSPDQEENSVPAFKVALMSDRDIGDKGPIDNFYKGLQQAKEELGVQVTFLPVTSAAEFESQLRALAEDGNNLIFTTFDTQAAAANVVAKDFPDTYFCILDGVRPEKLDNMKATQFNEHDGGFLAGVIAAKMTKTNKLGFVGGADIDIINRFSAGFEQGAKYVNPDITVERVFANSFDDPAKGKEMALLLYSKDIDVIHTAAAKTMLGVYEAANEVQKYVIGAEDNAADSSPDYGLTSVTENFSGLVFQMIKDAMNGNFVADDAVYGMQEGMMDISEPNAKIVPADVIQLVNEIREKVKSGEIKVEDHNYYK